jgi:hypothetical protein
MDGMRSCAPFLESMTSGYCLVTPCDIEFKKDAQGVLRAEWDSEIIAAPISVRDNATGSTIPRPKGYSSVHYVWQSQWGWQVPKGWSVLVTHPLNRLELPFFTLSAIVDSDSMFAHGNLPFFLQENFEGVIPENTPIAQLIPIKRAKWVHIINTLKIDMVHKQSKFLNQIPHFYRKNLLHRKEYK